MTTTERYHYIIVTQHEMIEEYTKMLKTYSGVINDIKYQVKRGIIEPEEGARRYKPIDEAMERIVENMSECYATIRFYRRKIKEEDSLDWLRDNLFSDI